MGMAVSRNDKTGVQDEIDTLPDRRADQMDSNADNQNTTEPHPQHIFAPPPPLPVPRPPPPGTGIPPPLGPQQQAPAQVDVNPDPLAELKKDPEYIKYERYLKILNRLENEQMFAKIDRDFADAFGLGKNDGQISMADIQAAQSSSDPEVAMFAKELWRNPDVLAFLDDAGGRNQTISAAALRDKYQEVKSKISSMENEARQAAAPKNSATPPTPVPTDTGAGPTKTGPGVTDEAPATADPSVETPRPSLSKLSGLEGATENAANLVMWCEDEINRYTQLMGKETDSNKQRQLSLKVEQLTRQMQSLSAMQNQLETMMSTLMKIYSDMAMNAIRNMH